MPYVPGELDLSKAPIRPAGRASRRCNSHTWPVRPAAFDDPNLVSSAGLVLILALARSAGLGWLADQHLSVPTDKGANAGLKVSSLVAGMVAGADSIDDMAVLRHGAMGRVFTGAYAPSTLARSCGRSPSATSASSTRSLPGSWAGSPLPRRWWPGSTSTRWSTSTSAIIEVHGYAKAGSGYGYSGIRGLNALLATVTTKDAAPVIVTQRLRKGSCGSPRGAKRLVADALTTVKELRTDPAGAKVLLGADSAFCGRGAIGAAVRAGAQVSVTVRLDKLIRTTIAAIPDDAWTTIQYTDAVFDEATGTWISWAEVAEVLFPAFAAGKKTAQVPGRLVADPRTPRSVPADEAPALRSPRPARPRSVSCRDQSAQDAARLGMSGQRDTARTSES